MISETKIDIFQAGNFLMDGFSSAKQIRSGLNEWSYFAIWQGKYRHQI